MPNISISVKNKIAVQTNRTLYVCGNSDYTAIFDLDAEWNAFEIKTARFCYNGHYSDVVFTGNECEIPVIADTNEFEIGLFAGNLHTTTPAMVLCERSILSTSGTPTNPSPDVYHQLIEKINSGMLRGPQGEKGDPGKDAPQIDDGTISRDSPWSSRQIIEVLCPALEETGNPVVCYLVVGYPLGVVARWEPTQAGSGEPYPAGGGPQLLDISRCTATVGKPYGLTITIDGDIIKCSGVPSAEVTTEGYYSFAVASSGQEELRGKGYKVTAWPIKGKVSNAWGLRTADESSLAISAELSPGVDTDIQLRLMVSKDTPTAYAPYENIRPISGRDAVTVQRCGENLLDEAQFPIIKTKNNIKTTSEITLPAGTYTVCALSVANGVYAYGADVEYTYDSNKHTFALAKQTAIRLNAYWSKGRPEKDENIWLVEGNEWRPYTPYIGSINTLTLPETVYGGEVDAVSGAGDEKAKIITIDGAEMKFTSRNSYWNLPFLSAQGIVKNGVICSSHFNKDKFGVNTTYEFVFVMSVDMAGLFASSDELNAYCAAQYAAGTPVQIAYKLATSTPITATGNGPIMPLEGETNTIMTDADSVAVTGRADPAHAIAALQAQLAVATQALVETQAAMLDTTAMAVDYIYEQDCDAIVGGEDADAE